MVNRPFRVAFWALAINVGLSLCWLASDPEKARLALQTSPAPQRDREGMEPQQVLLADSHSRSNTSATPAAREGVDHGSSPSGTQSAAPTVAATPPIAPAPEPHVDGVVIADNDLPPPINLPRPETPPLPVREVSASNDGNYPWVLHDASRATFGTGKFEELPPPPEFSDEMEADIAGARSAESDHETAAQLASLGERLDELHGELAELRTSHAAVEQTLTGLAALSESVATPRALASPLEVRAVVMEAPLTGELRDGVLRALRRSGAAGEVDIDDESWQDVAWGVCESRAGVVTAWLQNMTSTGRMAQRTVRLAPGATAELDLWRLLPPRMVQARGSYVFERATRPDWGGGLELRCPEVGTAAIELEFRSSGPAGRGTSTPTDWQLMTIPDGGTLIVTGLRDGRADRNVDAGGRIAPHEHPVGQSEIVVILSPRRVTTDPESVPEPARLLPAIEVPDLPANDE